MSIQRFDTSNNSCIVDYLKFKLPCVKATGFFMSRATSSKQQNFNQMHEFCILQCMLVTFLGPGCQPKVGILDLYLAMFMVCLSVVGHADVLRQNSWTDLDESRVWLAQVTMYSMGVRTP